jgi:hypothetical protein
MIPIGHSLIYELGKSLLLDGYDSSMSPICLGNIAASTTDRPGLFNFDRLTMTETKANGSRLVGCCRSKTDPTNLKWSKCVLRDGLPAVLGHRDQDIAVQIP